MTLTVEIHEEDGVLWGQVVELPGCFATGDDLDEFAEALGEAIALYQSWEAAPAMQRTPVRGRRYPGRPDDPHRRLRRVTAPAGSLSLRRCGRTRAAAAP
jgi:hypothetical protein